METEIASHAELNYPRLVRRIQFIFIDTLIILISMFLISYILSNFKQTPNWFRRYCSYDCGSSMNLFV